MRIARAVIILLESLEARGPQERLQALRRLHDEVLYSALSSLQKNTARVLIQIMKDLVRAAPHVHIPVSYTHLPRGIDVIAAGDRQGDMELAVALERLDGDTPGTARLQARWQLSRGGEALDRGIYAASEDAGMSSASLVAAQSRLLQGLGEHLAERLLPRLKGGR